MLTADFWCGKNVFLTGHTGFKGSWLSMVLISLGANVTGYSLQPSTVPSLHNILQISKDMKSIIGDIRDFDFLKKSFMSAKPEIVFHLAAQPIVRDSYRSPRYTYETNVMGTVNILECIRESGTVRSAVNITTDKVYRNKEWVWAYRENEELNGYDPYSNSKSCSELVTSSYINSFFKERQLAVSTARAGNVIGGGDFSSDRIVPDCVRAAAAGQTIYVRNPDSIRPYQHVLEPLSAYMQIAVSQYRDYSLAGSYNVGPHEKDCIRTGTLVDLFVKCWGEGLKWESRSDGGPHEAGLLKLDCSLLKNKLGWQPVWDIETAIQKTVEWSKCWLAGKDAALCMEKQIKEYFKEARR